ncbi:unnamed protein product [Jaminaea pallidilutea]
MAKARRATTQLCKILNWRHTTDGGPSADGRTASLGPTLGGSRRRNMPLKHHKTASASQRALVLSIMVL